MAACFSPIKTHGASIKKSELKNNLNMSRWQLKKFDDKIESEKSKNYGQVREPIHEYFSILHSTYLACSQYLKSKIPRLYFDVVVFW